MRIRVIRLLEVSQNSTLRLGEVICSARDENEEEGLFAAGQIPYNWDIYFSETCFLELKCHVKAKCF